MVPIVENLVYDKKSISSGTFNSHILWFLWSIMISINWGDRSKCAKSKELEVTCLNGGTHWALPASFGFCSFLEAMTAEVACFGKACSFNLISTLFLGIQPLSCLPVCWAVCCFWKGRMQFSYKFYDILVRVAKMFYETLVPHKWQQNQAVYM